MSDAPDSAPSDGNDLRLLVRDVDVVRASGVTVTFGDDVVATFALEDLRSVCPCAGCRGERDQGITPWPKPSSPRPLTITDANLVGAWGIAFTWNDGHAAGIYPFESLRRWADDREPPRNRDESLGT